MTKAILEQIEKQMIELDAEAMSFDHEEAEHCKAALVRIAMRAATLCQEVSASPIRSVKGAARWQVNHDRMAREVEHSARVSRRRSISVGKENADD